MENFKQTEFDQKATQEIDYIANLIETQDKDFQIDVDFAGDVLHLDTEFGEYVINKHRVMQQIWLSSPVSGPHHFSFVEGKQLWFSSKGFELRKIICAELSEKTNCEFKV